MMRFLVLLLFASCARAVVIAPSAPMAAGFHVVSALDVPGYDVEPFVRDLIRRADPKAVAHDLTVVRAIAAKLPLVPPFPVTIGVLPAELCATTQPPQDPIGEAMLLCGDAEEELIVHTLVRAVALVHPSTPQGSLLADVLVRRGLANRYAAYVFGGAPFLSDEAISGTMALLAIHFADNPLGDAASHGLDALELERLAVVVTAGLDASALSRPECDAKISEDTVGRTIKRLRAYAGNVVNDDGLQLLVDGTVVQHTMANIGYQKRVLISHQHTTAIVIVSEQKGIRQPVVHTVGALTADELQRLDAALAALDLKATKDHHDPQVEDAGSVGVRIDGPRLHVRFTHDDTSQGAVYRAVWEAIAEIERRVRPRP